MAHIKTQNSDIVKKIAMMEKKISNPQFSTLKVGDILELGSELFVQTLSNEMTYRLLIATNENKAVQIPYFRLIESSGTFLPALICGTTRKFKVSEITHDKFIRYQLDAIF